MPGGKSLSFASPKESDQRKGAPAQPRIPENRACRVGGEELAPLMLYFKGQRGSNTFAADPPGKLAFRRGREGKNVNIRPVVTGWFVCLFGHGFDTRSHSLVRDESVIGKLVLTFLPLSPAES
jgi:hypothetical protein